MNLTPPPPPPPPACDDSVATVEPGPDKAIVITGCDSGFGKQLALTLARKGFRVYACCLTQRAADELKKEVSVRACWRVKGVDGCVGWGDCVVCV